MQSRQLLNGISVVSDGGINRNILSSLETLANGQFHCALLDRFAPIVESYLSLMETSITKFLVTGIEKETWVPMSDEGTQAGELSVFIFLDVILYSAFPVHFPE